MMLVAISSLVCYTDSLWTGQLE